MSFSTIRRFLEHVGQFYLPLAVLGASAYCSTPLQLQQMNVWTFMLPFAVLMGLMGALDPGETITCLYSNGTGLNRLRGIGGNGKLNIRTSWHCDRGNGASL